MTVNEYKELIKGRLNEKRYNHSLCVADEARRLAEKYGGDPEKMYLAGLLHDITKNTDEQEQLQLLTDGGIILSDIEKASPFIWHAVSGAVFVRDKLGITDEDILSAIRYHSTARADMSLSEKIVYIADLTSADREYPDIDKLRQLVNASLDDAIVYALAFTLRDLSDKKRPIHPDTLYAYNYLLLNKTL